MMDLDDVINGLRSFGYSLTVATAIAMPLGCASPTKVKTESPVAQEQPAQDERKKSAEKTEDKPTTANKVAGLDGTSTKTPTGQATPPTQYKVTGLDGTKTKPAEPEAKKPEETQKPVEIKPGDFPLEVRSTNVLHMIKAYNMLAPVVNELRADLAEIKSKLPTESYDAIVKKLEKIDGIGADVAKLKVENEKEKSPEGIKAYMERLAGTIARFYFNKEEVEQTFAKKTDIETRVKEAQTNYTDAKKQADLAFGTMETANRGYGLARGELADARKAYEEAKKAYEKAKQDYDSALVLRDKEPSASKPQPTESSSPKEDDETLKRALERSKREAREGMKMPEEPSTAPAPAVPEPTTSKSNSYEQLLNDAKNAYQAKRLSNAQYDSLLRDVNAGKESDAIRKTYLSEGQK